MESELETTVERLEQLARNRESPLRTRRVMLLEEDEYLQMRDDMAKMFQEASPIDNESGKWALCETLATLMMHQKTLFELQAKGKLAAEEARTLPSVASGIKRLAADLKISGKVKEEDPFDVD